MTASLFYRPLALKRSTDWPLYTEDRALPRVYGRNARVRVFPYRNEDRTLLLAGHPCNNLHRVWRGTDIYSRATLRTIVGPDGSGLAAIDTQDRIEPGETWIAEVDGLPSRVSGLADNPADVILDLIRATGNLSLAELQSYRSRLTPLRLECANLGIQITGVVDDRYQTLAEAVQDICNSIVARWSPTSPEFAKLFPVTERSTGDRLWASLADRDFESFEAEASITDLVTVAPIAFAYDFSANSYRGSLLLASSTRGRFGDIRPDTTNARILAPWIGTQRIARRVYSRWLAYKSRPIWTGTGGIGSQGKSIPVLGWVSLSHRHWPGPAEVFVSGRERNPLTGETSLRIEGATLAEPTITVIGTGSGADREATEATYEYRNNTARIKVTDADGIPAAGATVILGSRSALANASGVALFPDIEPGTYRLEVRPVEGEPLIFDEYEIAG